MDMTTASGALVVRDGRLEAIDAANAFRLKVSGCDLETNFH
jgi:hypothetical protein